MKIIFLNKTNHESIVNKMITEDFIADHNLQQVSLRALGLQIKSVSVINNETVVYIDSFENLLLG